MRTNDLKSRIRAAYNIVRYGCGHFRMMTCGKCGSIIIHRMSENEVNTRMDTRLIRYGVSSLSARNAALFVRKFSCGILMGIH